MRPIRVGYLHIGPPDGGVYRLGRLLAAKARSRPVVSVIEASATSTGRWAEDRAKIAAVGRQLADTDLVHLQYNCQRERLAMARIFDQHLNAYHEVLSRPTAYKFNVREAQGSITTV